MSEVLVLVDHLYGAVRKPTYELLAIAKRIGSPSAVVIGGADKAAAAAEAVKGYGADEVYVVDDAEIKGYLVAPKAEVLEQLAEKIADGGPAAILVPASAEGKEIAGRLSLELSSGLITDALDVRGDGEDIITTQSVFAGNFTVEAKVVKGTPIIAVKPNAAAPEQGGGAGGGGGVRGRDLRCCQGRADRRGPAAPGDRSSRADRGRDRGLGWPGYRW
jgi:electron transfer flavoprotein alpha subunit